MAEALVAAVRVVASAVTGAEANAFVLAAAWVGGRAVGIALATLDAVGKAVVYLSVAVVVFAIAAFGGWKLFACASRSP